MPKESELQQRMGQIEELVQEIQAGADPTFRERAIKLVELLLEVHGAGLDRILELIADTGAAGDALIDGFTREPLVNSLMLLHGLHPLTFDERLQKALAKVRPYLQSHKGNVELLGVDDGVIRLRLEGSCHGCPSSSMTLKLAIEESIAEFVPDAAGLVVEGVVAPKPPPVFVPLTTPRASTLAAKADGRNGASADASLLLANGSVADPAPVVEGNGWDTVEGLDALAKGEVRTLDVLGVAVMCCRVGQDLYAYRNACPACGESITSGQRIGGIVSNDATVTCSHCGLRYDAIRAGRGLDNPSLTLEPFPLLVEGGRVKIAVPVMS